MALPVAHHSGELLGELIGGRDRRLVSTEAAQIVPLLVRQLVPALDQQAGYVTGRRRRVPGARWRGGRSGRLPFQALEEAEDVTSAMLIPLRPDFSVQPRPIATALCPALLQVGLVRLQHAGPRALGTPPLRWVRQVQVAIDRRTTDSHQVGDVELR